MNYNDIRNGRRIFTPDVQSIPTRQTQGNLWEANDFAEQYSDELVNLVRKEVGQWRDSKYEAGSPTRVTKELLLFWFENPDRYAINNLFFCQREAIETAIWLNEIAEKGNGHIRRILYMPALTVVRIGVEPFVGTYQRIFERTGVKMKAYTAVQRKLLVLAYTLYKNGAPFEIRVNEKEKAAA